MEFLNLVLPATSAELQELAKHRSGYLNYDVEYTFAKILEREIAYQRAYEKLNARVAERFDFGPMEAFKAMDLRES
jgi:hypothetical protein